MLFKMLGIENSWQQNSELRPERPRQLFVTQSRMLADKVEEYFIKLLQSLVLPTQNKSDISDILERQRNREEAGLVDQDEALNWREDLPQKFSELQDSHFPMFITFDKVCFTSGPFPALTSRHQLSAMIEADMSHPLSVATDQSLGAGLSLSSEYMLQRRNSFISFDVFREEYWAHFPQPLTKGLGSSRLLLSNNYPTIAYVFIFSPQTSHLYLASSWVTVTRHYRSRCSVDHVFLGVIKGSETTLNSENHSLDYDTYSNLSARTQATFASKRSEIYSLFEIYTKKKRDRREYDAADRYAPRLFH
jgi:hypothetical protein